MKLIHHKLENGPFADPSEYYEKSPECILDCVHKVIGLPYPWQKEKNIEKLAKEESNRVFLLAHGDDTCASNGEVYITANRLRLVQTLEHWNNNCTDMDRSIIHLQEYESFEQAYMVAISLREGHPLCYNEQ